MSEPHAPPEKISEQGPLYHFLQPQQIAMIDEALCSLGEFGEVRLVVDRGRLRFVITQRSFDAFKWQPGMIKSGAGG